MRSVIRCKTHTSAQYLQRVTHVLDRKYSQLLILINVSDK